MVYFVTPSNRYWAMSLYEYGSALPIDTPDGSRYLGCFQDNREERALGLKMTTSSDMTPQVWVTMLATVRVESK